MPFDESPVFPAGVAGVADLLNVKNKVPGQASPTLASGINDVVTSFSVASGTGARLPADNFSIAVFGAGGANYERMFVGSRTGDALSGVTRGIDGTSGTSHNAGEAVEAFYAAAHHNQLAAQVNSIEAELGTDLQNVQKTADLTDSEVPSGTINGSNVTFTLANAPSPASSLQLFLNGLLQTAGGVDYTLSGSTITYGVAPETGDAHVAWYRK